MNIDLWQATPYDQAPASSYDQSRRADVSAEANEAPAGGDRDCLGAAADAELLEKGGPPMWEQFMEELRQEHLGTPSGTPAVATVRSTLQAGYEAVMARKAGNAAAG